MNDLNETVIAEQEALTSLPEENILPAILELKEPQLIQKSPEELFEIVRKALVLPADYFTELEAKANELQITDLEDKVGYKAVYAFRQANRKNRLAYTEFTGKMKVVPREIINIINEYEKPYEASWKKIEASLQAKEDQYEEAKKAAKLAAEKAKKEKLQNRIKELLDVGHVMDIDLLEALSDEEYAKTLEDAKSDFETKNKLEQQRLAALEEKEKALEQKEIVLETKEEELQQKEEVLVSKATEITQKEVELDDKQRKVENMTNAANATPPQATPNEIREFLVELDNLKAIRENLFTIEKQLTEFKSKIGINVKEGMLPSVLKLRAYAHNVIEKAKKA